MIVHVFRLWVVALLCLSTSALAQSITFGFDPDWYNPQWKGRQDDVYVKVKMHSQEYELRSVIVTVDGLSAPMAPVTTAPIYWTTILDFTGVPAGSKTLVITATDAAGNTAQATRTILFDRPPAITWAEPLGGWVATPSLRVKVTCTDVDEPAGCPGQFQVNAAGELIASGTGGIDQKVSLASFNGTSVKLAFGSLVRTIHVEGSGRLEARTRVYGLVVAADARRVLFTDLSPGGRLTLLDRESGATLVAPHSFGVSHHVTDESSYVHAFLTPDGFIYLNNVWIEEGGRRIFQVREGSVRDLGPGEGLRVNGRWAAWVGPSRILKRYDTSTGELVDVASGILNVPEGFGVGPTGEVAYTDPDSFELRIWSEGGVRTLARSTPGVYHLWPESDGQNWLYTRGQSTLLHDGTREHVLTTTKGRGRHAISHGVVMFGGLSGSGVSQVYRRDAAGNLQQLTFFAQPSIPDELSPTGELMVKGGNGRRYLFSADGTMTEIGSSYGWSHATNTGWLVRMGQVLFEVNPHGPLVRQEPEGEPGSPDGGTQQPPEGEEQGEERGAFGCSATGPLVSSTAVLLALLRPARMRRRRSS